jgi:hypothetical protein
MELAARRSLKALLLALFIGYQIFTHFVLRDSPSAAAITGVTHAAAYLVLLWYFGRTLRRGEQALITRLALSVHGSLPPAIEAFTRRVTLAWCLFFAAQLLGSAALLAFAPYEAWSTFVNLLNVPLLAMMFVGDHLYRAVRFPDHPRASMARILRAFAEITSTSKAH